MFYITFKVKVCKISQCNFNVFVIKQIQVLFQSVTTIVKYSKEIVHNIGLKVTNYRQQLLVITEVYTVLGALLSINTKLLFLVFNLSFIILFFFIHFIYFLDPHLYIL